ncbi:MAG TPA: cytochrome c biogenesis CcdA family protein [Acidimicrobiales bacterium]|nr:cytochrome c biogenesis CcdA family protein [Acidimicrobiales bacterium]
MIDAPILLAFTAGMVATVNPCGFAMLPAYLSFFLGDEELSPNRSEAVAKAIGVGAAVSGGFLLVFGIAGAAFTFASLSIAKWSQWLTLVIGAGLVVLGIAMLGGFELAARLPKLNKGGKERSTRSMFVFGISYAIASISCTLPIFTGTVTSTFNRSNFLSGLTVFLAYSIGMALVLVALTVSLALAKSAFVGALRRALPYINRVSGVLVILAGLYIAYYSWFEIQVTQYGNLDANAGPVDVVTDWSDSINQWVNQTGATQIGLVLALIVSASSVGFILKQRSRTSS